MRLLIVDDEIYAIQGIIDSIQWDTLEIDDIITANSYAQALNYFVKEKIDILLCDIEMPFGSGLDLVEWVRSNYSDTQCIFLTCHSEFDFARQAVGLQVLDYIVKPAVPETIVEILKKAIHNIRDKELSYQYEEYGKRYIESVGQYQEKASQKPKDIVGAVKKYIQDNISESLTVEEIAGTVYLSPDYLTRMFKKQEGQTIIDYITEQRMILAKELLEQNKITITMISARVGYSNYSHFTKMFKKYYGETPRDYQSKRLS